ncbi:inositol polyphosphate 1-phosphatase [Calliphora vicina]|uniref:inositol polyphosphate 1-phosphatase n=1 Tax=Calliphora vicina TaxID=7373 RepID=UPI00325A6C26
MGDSSRHLLKSLINASEKAANIARICRSNEQLLGLLVQEKTGDEANARFEHDFKTLADVLIQESIKHDVGAEFPEMKENIKGEESSTFKNAEDESVAIVVGANETETADCLLQILQTQHQEAAQILAEEVHRSVEFDKELHEDFPELPNDVDYSQLGIWIDPIDATAEYISGDTMFTNFPGITSTGLDCVTVLIGVYDLSSGLPVIGVISQPFGNKIEDNIYNSALYWGIALPDLQAHSKRLDSETNRSRLLGIFSSSERADLLQQMLDLGYEFAFSAGAGHKALKVITGEVDVYVLSKASTFKWDTCAPQAILRSLNGDIIDFKNSIKEGKAIPLTYTTAAASENSEEGGDETEGTDKDWKCNCNGLIAIKDLKLLEHLLEKLAES